MYSSTIILNHNKLNGDDELTVTIIRLMMACNDISLANSCLAAYQDADQTRNKDMNIAACMYFVRLQIGHVQEGLKIVKEIKEDKKFNNMVNRLSKSGKLSFNKLCACVDGKDKTWQRYFAPIRHNLSFHYNDKNGSKLILRAFRERISKIKETSKITVGDIKRMRFELGDQATDVIVCRYIFSIPYKIDLQKDRGELDRILMYGSGIGDAFLRFASEFIYKIAE